MPYLVCFAVGFGVGLLVTWRLFDHEPETTINWLRSRRR